MEWFWILIFLIVLVIVGRLLQILDQINDNLKWLKEYIEDTRP
ncbi:MAG: hypothetical protein ACJZ16_04795 [Methylophilaceae bacterium]